MASAAMSSHKAPIGKMLATPIKGLSDKKEYRSFELVNGLRVLLISDQERYGPPSAAAENEELDNELEESDSEDSAVDDGGEEGDDDDEDDEDDEDDSGADDGAGGGGPPAPRRGANEYKAAAALAVSFGSCEDPPELPGLMHFLEHMVFMGSKKYPKENSFDDFIRRHGGNDNAYTDSKHTNFHFDVHEAYLWEALDRFSQFFVSPLMKKNAMERERNAVDSEFTMALPEDDNREQQLLSSLASAGHPLTKFSWGNAASLSLQPDDTVHATLHRYREKFYSSQFMTLAVQSRHSLDDMQEKVAEIFSQVPNNGLPPSTEILPFPFPASAINKVIKMDPMKARHVVTITWFLPSVTGKYRRHPLRLLSNLLGHEGHGSLLSFYKARNWACSLEVESEMSDFDDNCYCCQLRVIVELTEEGFEHVQDVLLALFQYTALLRKQPPSKEMFLEYQQLASLNVDFEVESEPMSNVEGLAANMLEFEPEDYLTGATLMFEYDPQFSAETTARLTPDSANIIIRSRLLGDFTGEDVQTEKWFGTKYIIEDISPEWRSLFANADTTPNPSLHLPRHNDFIPSDFSLLDSPAQDAPAPQYPREIVHDANKGSLYYKSDHTFQLPLSDIRMQLILEDRPGRRDPKFLDEIALLLQCLRYQLMEPVYDAALAKYSYHVSYTQDGLIITVSGFTHHIQRVLDLLMSYLVNFASNFSEQHFNTLKDLEIRRLYTCASKPAGIRNQLRLHMLLPRTELSLQHLQLTQQVTAKEVLACAADLLKNAKVTMLVQGTMKEEAAIAVYEKIQQLIPRDSPPVAATISHIPTTGYRVLRDGITVVRVKTTNMADGNSAIANYYQGQPGTIRSQVLLDFVSCAIEEQCFDTLRTQEQLGYSVFSQANETNGIIGLTIYITPQAEKFNLVHVDTRIEAFLCKFEEHLSSMSEASFTTLRQTVRSMKTIDDLSLAEEVGRNWTEIIRKEYLFDRLNKQVELIPSITKAEVLEFYRSLVCPSSAGYRKLSVQVVGCAEHASKKPPPVVLLLAQGLDTLEFLPQEPSEGIIPSECPLQPYYVQNCEEYCCQLKEMPAHPIL